MKLEGKACKTFINRLIKLCSLINRYNVDPVSLVQFYITEKEVEPVLINKPKDVDCFEYLQEIYTDSPVYSRIIKYLDKSKIRKKKDPTQYAPIVIACNKPITFLDIDEKDLFDNKYLLPFKYNKFGVYTDVYFIIGDLLKDFIGGKIVSAIEIDEFDIKIFDENNCVYDTTNFLIPNRINETLITKFIKENSPKSIFPIKLSEEKDKIYFTNEIKEILINLNTSLLNSEVKDVVSFNKDVGTLNDEDIELEKILKSLKLNGTFYIENKAKTIKILTFDEFFKGMIKEILFMKKETITQLIDGTSVPIVHAGLLLKFKENLIYVFYKYFKYDGD